MERISALLKRLKRKARAGQTVEDALEKNFRTFDTDRDGLLTFGEFRSGEAAATTAHAPPTPACLPLPTNPARPRRSAEQHDRRG